MANLNLSGFKRWLAVSCTHGRFINWEAANAVIQFCNEHKIDFKLHLGDRNDQTAYRSGAFGTPDEAASIIEDLDNGDEFLEAFRPQVIFNGNHDRRPYKLLDHRNAIMRMAAAETIRKTNAVIEKLGAKFIEGYDTRKSFYRLGDAWFFHGWRYSDNAVRMNAKRYGKCVFGHVHTLASETVDRVDVSGANKPRCGDATAYCCGLLADIDKLSDAYAGVRENTGKWKNGFAWGMYSSKELHAWLAEIRNGKVIFP